MSTSIEDIISQELQEPETNNIEIEEESSNIKSNIKKVSFSDEVNNISLLSELNETNILIIGLIFIASYQSTNIYLTQFPIIGKFVTSDMSSALLKTILLIVIFIFAKRIILPQL